MGMTGGLTSTISRLMPASATIVSRPSALVDRQPWVAIVVYRPNIRQLLVRRHVVP